MLEYKLGDDMLTIDMKPSRGVLFVRLSGVLNKINTEKLNEEVVNFQKKAGIKNIVFNLSELEDIDKDGKYALVNSFNICKHHQGQSFICLENNVNIKEKLKDCFQKNEVVADELTAIKIINS